MSEDFYVLFQRNLEFSNYGSWSTLLEELNACLFSNIIFKLEKDQDNWGSFHKQLNTQKYGVLRVAPMEENLAFYYDSSMNIELVQLQFSFQLRDRSHKQMRSVACYRENLFTTWLKMVFVFYCSILIGKYFDNVVELNYYYILANCFAGVVVNDYCVFQWCYWYGFSPDHAELLPKNWFLKLHFQYKN